MAFFPVKSVREWCHRYKGDYRLVAPKRETDVVPALLFGTNKPALAKSKAYLPEAYVAHLENVNVYSGSLLTVVHETALYDDAVENWMPGYSIGLVYPNAKIDQGILRVKEKPIDLRLSCALNLCSGANTNYFHFLLETLPRLAMADTFLEWKGYPILIEIDLPPQMEEALNLINTHNRAIIRVKRFSRIQVDRLVVPGRISLIRENYDLTHRFEHDFVFAKEFTDEVHGKLNLPAAQPNKLLYISRRGTSFRRLLNEDEIESYIVRHGFEIVRPELLSFEEQRQLFSQAKLICGPSGSGITNMMLAPAGTRVLVITSNNKRIDLYYWSQVADKLGHRLATAVGTEVPGTAFDVKWEAHNNYSLPLASLRETLIGLCEGQMEFEEV